MNPSPILIIRNTFPTHLHALLFSASFYSENTKTYLLSRIHIKPKKYLSHIIFTLLHYYLLYLLSHPKIWNVKINKNRNHVCLNWLKFHKELKLFLKALLGKPFQTFYNYYLKNFFEKTKYQNIIFLYLLFKLMQVACKE
jgi:hypothetical protein